MVAAASSCGEAFPNRYMETELTERRIELNDENLLQAANDLRLLYFPAYRAHLYALSRTHKVVVLFFVVVFLMGPYIYKPHRAISRWHLRRSRFSINR